VAEQGDQMTSTCTWRDSAVIPENYESVASMVAAARKACGRVVNFDWHFATDDLRQFRRGVYEWGRKSAGQYKCFDARVLSAIKGALNDGDSTFELRESSSDRLKDCAVSCLVDGGTSRLHGHAPFGVIFGYGMAGLDPNASGHAHLGTSVQTMLVEAVGMLNWDLAALRGATFQPVRNVIYGLPASYGISEPGPAPGPATDVNVHFHGPFSAVNNRGDRCLFRDDMATRSGIYLWTVPVDGHERVFYVGQTRRGFGQRTSEHLAGFLSGRYPTLDMDALSRGEFRHAEGAVSWWPSQLPTFLQNFEKLAPNVIGTIRLMRFHCAPLAGDAHLHNRVEGAIADCLRKHEDPLLRNFLSPGLKVPSAIPFDAPLRLLFSSDVPIAGLPPQRDI